MAESPVRILPSRDSKNSPPFPVLFGSAGLPGWLCLSVYSSGSPEQNRKSKQKRTMTMALPLFFQYSCCREKRFFHRKSYQFEVVRKVWCQSDPHHRRNSHPLPRLCVSGHGVQRRYSHGLSFKIIQPKENHRERLQGDVPRRNAVFKPSVNEQCFGWG